MYKLLQKKRELPEVHREAVVQPDRASTEPIGEHVGQRPPRSGGHALIKSPVAQKLYDGVSVLGRMRPCYLVMTRRCVVIWSGVLRVTI